MRLNEYQKLAMRTSPDGHDRVKNGCMGLIGESGELMDVLKKHMFQSGENPQPIHDRVIDECGDVMWYCAELAYGLEIPLGFTEHYNDLPGYVPNLPIESVVAKLSFIASAIYRTQNFDELSNDGPDAIPGWRVRNTVVKIGKVIGLVEAILSCYESRLDIALERNIKKLQARYPDGFDPEKSINREHERLPWEEA